MSFNKKMAENWQPYLNVMQRVAVELEIARTCLREPTVVQLGRKELYELKRDWAHKLVFNPDGKTPERVLNLKIQRVDATSFLNLL